MRGISLKMDGGWVHRSQGAVNTLYEGYILVYIEIMMFGKIFNKASAMVLEGPRKHIIGLG
jgi:hypothetical protein